MSKKKDHVTFVKTPFTDKSTEVRAMQGMDEELDLDSDLDLESEGELDLDDVEPLRLADDDFIDMDSLSERMKQADDRHLEEIEAITGDSVEEDSEDRLAKEIEEDEALAASESEALAEALEVDEELQAALPALPEADEQGNLDLAEVESCIETLLFMSDKPVSLNKLREWLGPEFPKNIFDEAITSMKERYQSIHHGIELVEVSGGYQLRTKPGRAALAKRLAKVQTQRLSSGAMETLAIVAYKQPVMKEEIDKVRGVDSSHFIRGLLDKKLIKIAGRSELPGRPMVYATSDEFLQLFGLADLNSLPSLRELEQMVPSSETRNPDDEDPRVREMRKLVNQMKMDPSAALKYDPREDEEILKSIREQVNAIPTSTPYLEAQKEQEKLEKLAAQGLGPLAEGAREGAKEEQQPKDTTSDAETAPPSNA